MNAAEKGKPTSGAPREQQDQQAGLKKPEAPAGIPEARHA